jgi:hypothetical protein
MVPLLPLLLKGNKTRFNGFAQILVAVGLFLVSALSSCTQNTAPTPTITICDMPDSQGPCADDQEQFSVGQKLFARLEADEPFQSQQIIGKILRLTDADTIPLGARVVTPQADQRTVVQSLPFHEFGPQAAGTFLIEFIDESERVLAQKQITISGVPLR